MSLNAKLLEILACPEDKGPLFYVESESLIYNKRLKRVYEVKAGIPVMLISESRSVDAGEHDRIMAKITAENIQPTFIAH
jgi:uncharacterized protein YbaR (Trm112 family)